MRVMSKATHSKSSNIQNLTRLLEQGGGGLSVDGMVELLGLMKKDGIGASPQCESALLQVRVWSVVCVLAYVCSGSIHLCGGSCVCDVYTRLLCVCTHFLSSTCMISKKRFGKLLKETIDFVPLILLEVTIDIVESND